MNKEALRRKMHRLLEDELTTGKLEWYYLSFAGEEGFRGGCIVKACGPHDAVQQAHRLHINPGGQVVTFAIECPEIVKPEHTNRLLSLKDMQDLDMEPQPLEDDR